MTNKIVATIHSTAAPSLILLATYAIRGDLGRIKNEAPVATGPKAETPPKSLFRFSNVRIHNLLPSGVLQILARHSAQVVRLARSFEAVQREQRRAVPPLGLPVAAGENLGVGRDLEQPRLRRGQRDVAARRPAPHGHDMAALEAPAGDERLHVCFIATCR